MIAQTETGTTDTTTTLTLWSGWQLRETAGAAARVTFRRTNAAGAILGDVNLAANESAGEQFAAPVNVAGSPIITGVGAARLHVEVETGAVVWVVFGK